MIKSIDIALSGLLSSQKRLETSASNIANADTAGSLEDPENAPYTAKTTLQTPDEPGGVKTDIATKNPPFVPAFDPGSPFANEEGHVGAPNVNLTEEAVNVNLAELTFKANAQILKTVSELQETMISAFGGRNQ